MKDKRAKRSMWPCFFTAHQAIGPNTIQGIAAKGMLMLGQYKFSRIRASWGRASPLSVADDHRPLKILADHPGKPMACSGVQALLANKSRTGVV